METTFTHKCPNCGGPLLFNPKDQKFHCEYCLNIYTEEEVTRYEQQQHEAHLENPSTTTAEENLTFTAEEESSATQQTETTENETTADAGTMEIFNCPSCGAQIVTDATTAATYCYYCHNPVVLAGRLSGEFYQKTSYPLQLKRRSD